MTGGFRIISLYYCSDLQWKENADYFSINKQYSYKNEHDKHR